MEMLDRKIFDRWREHAKEDDDVLSTLAESAMQDAQTFADLSRRYHAWGLLGEQVVSLLESRLKELEKVLKHLEGLDLSCVEGDSAASDFSQIEERILKPLRKAAEDYREGRWLTVPGQNPT